MPTDHDDPNVRICHDCGYANPPDATSCEQCNFPLGEGPAPAPGAAATQPPAGAAAPPPAIEPPPRLKRLREKRRRKGQDPSLALWLFVGALGAIALIFIGIQGFHQSNFPKVEGASSEQQARADQLREAIQKDSTNVMVRVALGDVLYDTGNWPEAIVQYRAALRMDSTRVEALVDLGVCYYNLGLRSDAQRHFELALAKEPGQPIALFNLGILSEGRDDPKAALGFYERALAANPPEHMRAPLEQAIARARQAAGLPATP